MIVNVWADVIWVAFPLMVSYLVDSNDGMEGRITGKRIIMFVHQNIKVRFTFLLGHFSIFDHDKSWD